MSLKNRIVKYLDDKYTMQLATVSGDQPWCCTVYYVVDDKLNLYWASLPSRRHSQEIASHPKVSAAIVVKNVNGEKVTGLQVEGTAEIIEDSEQILPIAEQYAQKFMRDQDWIEDFSNLQTEHRLYKLTPKNIVLFDEENLSDNPRQELKID